MVGLLALGDWGPATGAPAAVSGAITTEQPGQQSIASGTVVEPVTIVVGGGAVWRGRLLPQFETKIPEITGTISSAQPRQESVMTGDMIDTELELVTAIMLAVA